MKKTFRALLLLSAIAGLVGCASGAMDGLPPADQDAGAVFSEVGNPRDRAKAHTDLAAAYYGQGNMGVALEEIRQALSAESNYAPAYSLLALVQMELRDNKRAEAAFERALSINSKDADTNHNYAWFLCQNGREDESMRYFLAAIRNPLYSTPQKSYAQAGICALRRKNENDALDFFGKALRLDANYLPALINLAQLRYRRGELREARALIDRYNKISEPTAESLWLALRIERRFGNVAAENSYASQLRRRFAGSAEFQAMQKGRFE